MYVQGWSSSGPSPKNMTDVRVRCYLSESDEKEALRVLREQLSHQKRITSDDVRLAVRAVASQGGAVAIPPDFPPSRWVLEFRRVHGFVQPSSFVFDAAVVAANIGGKAAFNLPKRLEMAPLRPAPAPARATEPGSNSERADETSNSSNNSSNIGTHDKDNDQPSTSVMQVMGCSDDRSDDKWPSIDSRHSLPMLSETALAYSGPRPPFHNETQCQLQLQHNFSQRHRHQLQQQQRRAMIVGDRRRATAWPRGPVARLEDTQLGASSGSLSHDSSSTTGPSTKSSTDSSDTGSNSGREINSTLPRARQAVSNSGSSVDEMLDSASNASSSKDKRGYKLSHTVPAETWEKAIAAVEHQGMSLRTAAKMYGVHFAALHRRVKKRTQGGQANGNDGYFHPNDEAGIMRVVVARAELGVLMTFDELMRLVEAAALRKLPDISVDSARKLLTRFESRNAQSIRHIIDDWPPPQPAVNTSSSAGEGVRRQSQPYLEHPGFRFGPKPVVYARPKTSSGGGSVAVSAAAKTALLTPSSRISSVSTSAQSQVDKTKKYGLGSNPVSSKNNSEAPNGRLIFVGSRARSGGDNDPVMAV